MKLTIVLAVLFLGALLLLGAVLLYPLVPAEKITGLTGLLATQDRPQTVLRMSPASLTLPASGSAQILVTVDTKSNTIGTAQIEIGYDPRAITVTNVAAGDFFPSPQILLNSINPASGRISFAETTTAKEQKGSGTLAILTVWSRYPYLAQTTLNFYPKTGLMHLGQTTSLVSSSSGATILFPIFHPQIASTSAIPVSTSAALE